MRSIFKKISNNLDLTFFYFFILSIPLGTKLVFLSKDSYFTGAFVHYTTFFLYLSDIFFILALFFWILRQVKKSGFPIKPVCPVGRLRMTILRRIFLSAQSLKMSLKQNIIYYILFFFLICAVLSIFSAKNNIVGTYQVLKLFEFVLLFILAGKLINSLKKLYFCFILILSTGFTQAIISVAQYYKQSNLGLKWLGEPILSPDLAGVAKIVVDGEKIIRVYGTFPHPNVLAGFLLMSLFISFYFLFFYIKRRHDVVSPSDSGFPIKLGMTIFRRRHSGMSPSVSPFLKGVRGISLFKQFLKQNWQFLLLIALISIQFLAFILTFSRTAWLAGLFSLFCFIFLYYKNVSHETIPIFALFKRKFTSLIIIILIISCFSIILSPQISTRFELNKNDQAISDRFLFNSFSFEMIKKSPFLGVGMGNFVLNYDNFFPFNKEKIPPLNLLLIKGEKQGSSLESWQYQPVHNFYLLIAAEIGIIGLILFIFFIFKILKMAYLKGRNQIVSRETIFTQHINLCTGFISVIFLGFLFIGFFDHYFWTIQQGQLTFWLIAGLLLASCRINKTC